MTATMIIVMAMMVTVKVMRGADGDNEFYDNGDGGTLRGEAEGDRTTMMMMMMMKMAKMMMTMMMMMVTQKMNDE